MVDAAGRSGMVGPSLAARCRKGKLTTAGSGPQRECIRS